jgi:hypothetical protein
LRRGKRNRTALVGLGLGLLAAPSRAQDSASLNVERAVHLSWVRTPDAIECGDAGRVQADVVRRLGNNPFSEPSHVFIEAHVSRDAAAFQAELEMRDATGASLGSRQVRSDAPTCASLVSAAGLAIALMIDPDATSAPKPPKPPPKEPDKPAQRPVHVALPAPKLDHGSWFVAGVAAAKVLPRAALGLRLGGDVRLARRFDFEALLTFLPEQRQTLRGLDTGFSLTYATSGFCYRLLDDDNATLSGCGSASMGAMHAVSYAPARGRDGELLWSSVGLGLRAAWALAGPIVLSGGVEGGVPLTRHDYVVSRSSGADTVVFSDPAFAATLQIGLGVRF